MNSGHLLEFTFELTVMQGYGQASGQVTLQVFISALPKLVTPATHKVPDLFQQSKLPPSRAWSSLQVIASLQTMKIGSTGRNGSFRV